VKALRIAAASPVLIASEVLGSNRLFNLGAMIAGSNLRRYTHE
jgi:hypothetical protein